jgi:hypothetical protein
MAINNKKVLESVVIPIVCAYVTLFLKSYWQLLSKKVIVAMVVMVNDNWYDKYK